MERKTPIDIKIVQVNECAFEVEDDSILPRRIIKEYWTLDGRCLGCYDPLDEFSLINSDAIFEEYFEER